MRSNQRHLLPIQANFLRIACRLYSRLLSHREPLLTISMQRAYQLKWPRGGFPKDRFFDFPFHISCSTVTVLRATPSCMGKLSQRPRVTLVVAANWPGYETDCVRFNALIEGGSTVRFEAHRQRLAMSWENCTGAPGRGCSTKAGTATIAKKSGIMKNLRACVIIKLTSEVGSGSQRTAGEYQSTSRFRGSSAQWYR
jgi:hypothetical protein